MNAPVQLKLRHGNKSGLVPREETDLFPEKHCTIRGRRNLFPSRVRGKSTDYERVERE